MQNVYKTLFPIDPKELFQLNSYGQVGCYGELWMFSPKRDDIFTLNDTFGHTQPFSEILSFEFWGNNLIFSVTKCHFEWFLQKVLFLLKML